MQTDDFQKARELFERCLEHPPEERDRVLMEACDDEALCTYVRRLLAAHNDTAGDAGGFMKLEAGEPEYIGPYRILQPLGEGGMGIVYAAEQREPVRRRVAVKVLRTGYSSREVLARFEVERQALALMNHANIARILDAGTTADHRPYIVMEFVPGEPITQYCERRKVPLPARLLLFATVCDAVQHAHQRGVIHRDLKPSNILITEEDGNAVPKIIDFGIAKATTQRLTDRTLETKVGSLLGTPDYMSPEQAELSPLDIDTRADVYALGAVLYELLAGVTPLQLGGTGKSYTDMQRIINEQLPVAPSRRVGGLLQRQIRGELDWITLKALEKQRAHRYNSALELAADLRHHLANETVNAGPPSQWRRVRKFMRRHWAGIAAVAAVMLTLAISQLLLVQKNRELQAERDRANTEAETSARVTAFLTDIFNASSPNSIEASKITARELLHRGRQQIEQDESLPDGVRLQLLVALATAYRNLSFHEASIPLYREARSLLTSNGDPQFEFGILAELGYALAFAKRAREAREPLYAALRLADDDAAIPYEDTVRMRVAISEVELDLGNFEQAHAFAARDFAQARERFGLDSKSTLVLGRNLVYVYCMTAQFDAAERLVATLVPAVHRVFGEDHVAALKSMLGIMYTARGQLAEAERLYRPVYERMLVRFGPDAFPVQRMAHLYAVTHADAERGRRMLEDLGERVKRQYGSESPLLVEVWDNLALVLLRIPDRETEAARYLEQARVLAERVYGPDQLTTRGIYADIAKLHARAGERESALRFLRKVQGAPLFLFMVARDPDFAALRDDPEFIELLGPFADEIPD